MMMEKIMNLVLKKGLTTYKTKNSSASLPARIQAEKEDKTNKKGAVFVVRSKKHFEDERIKGYVITSMESLMENLDKLTHWTPNVYRRYHKDGQYIHGHSENNLQQINAFVVDIDTKKHSVQDILLSCLDNSVGPPTFILESDRGYQLYFVLEKAMYLTTKSNFKSLKVAKRIAYNIKKSLQDVAADPFCNDFGFFRIPTEKNVVWKYLDKTYDVADLINWSMSQDDNMQSGLYVVGNRKKASSYSDFTKTEWFRALINTTDIKGEKGQIGRNNAMFTIALVCYQANWKEEQTFDLLDQYNSKLKSPIKNKDVIRIVDSAYSGNYKGANKEYISILLESYVHNAASYNIRLNTNSHWYKHRKSRESRERSHWYEWEQDIIKYLSQAQTDKVEPFICHTQKELCQIVGIPQSTLNVVLKKSKLIIKKIEGVGRSAKTSFTTVTRLIKYAIEQKQEKQESYSTFLKLVFKTIINNPAKQIFIKQLEQNSLLPTTHYEQHGKWGAG